MNGDDHIDLEKPLRRQFQQTSDATPLHEMLVRAERSGSGRLTSRFTWAVSVLRQ